MSESKPVHIIALVGLAGSGKSSIADYLAQKGLPKVSFGSVIMQALDEANLEHTPENETMMRDKLRHEHGEDVVVRRVIKQLHGLINAGQRILIIDGLGAWTAYRALKHEFPGETSFIAIITPRRIRHRRLASRTVRPLTEQQTTDRDISEIERLNKGGVIAMADYFVLNDGTIEDLYQAVDKLELI